jgi:hypothetical protein
MTYECEAREAIQDFDDVIDLLGNIASRPRPMQKEKGMRFITTARSKDGLIKAEIISRGTLEQARLSSVRAFHVGIREQDNHPWKRHTLNLGAQLSTAEGQTGYQIRYPNTVDTPRLSLILPTLEQVPPELEEVFVRGIGIFCLNSD